MTLVVRDSFKAFIGMARPSASLISAASACASTSMSRRSETTAELDCRRHDLKPLFAESFVEAGKDVAVVAISADFVFSALDQHIGLEQAIDASNFHLSPPECREDGSNPASPAPKSKMVEAYTAGGESPPILMAEIVRFAILFGFKSQCGFCCRPQASKSKAGRGARSSDAPR